MHCAPCFPPFSDETQFNGAWGRGSPVAERKHFTKTRGAFHYAKDSGNFGRKSNEKARFGFSRQKYSGLPLEVVHFDPQSDRSLDGNSTFHFDKQFHYPTCLHFCREFGNGMKNGKSNSSWLARFDRKMAFHFPRVFSPLADRSIWHNGNHPQLGPTTDRSQSLSIFVNPDHPCLFFISTYAVFLY